MRRSENQPDSKPAPVPAGGPLVPLYGGADIVPGIQAFRRGDIVLYTVRGEPSAVQELIGQLDREGVGEVIALITHHAQPEPPETRAEGPTPDEND